ncbi:ABC-type nitrate/sulfonate/bicarbonate transport system, permease component [Micromonospora coriariae]|uniref:ABC-type nitrate/sulfonate/bicarbonate transport system, permease component n=1 Tax=Micromonospora coriariae TaxID=285665 RepID=A0A1C4X4D9_9ACTN|nr:ABC-type nitrate/sulfonate/bicarbonate transport system, permease component [Micromonospora coriariae]
MSRRILGPLVEITFPLVVLLGLVVWSSGSESFYFPPVTDIFVTFRETWLFERFGSDVVPSLYRLGAGYALACLLAVGVGVILGSSKVAARAAEPIVEFLRAVPPPALIPFGILVLGLGDQMKIFIIAMVCFWPVLLNTIDGIRGIDPTLLDTARAYGIRGFERLRSLVLPGASPQIFAGMRTSLSLALIMMVVSELVASTNGIGYFVLQSQRNFAIPEMWSGIVLLGLLGYLLNAVFLLVEHRVLAWHLRASAVTR